MPKLVPESTLAHFKDNGETNSQATSRGRLNGFLWFCKRPSTKLPDPGSRRLRILNEAICGKTIELLNERLGEAFHTPNYQLVINSNGELTALLSKEIDYDYMGDHELNRQQLLDLLPKPGLAEISTIRYSLLQDPDSFSNIGYSKHKLSSIDYGLANYLDLLKQNALMENESEHLSEIAHRDVFSISVASVFAGILQSVGDESPGFLAHHVIPSFNEKVAEFCETNKQEVLAFLKRVYRTYSEITSLLTPHDFKDKIIDELGINELPNEDQKMAENIINLLVKRAITLSETLGTLRRCSPTQFLEIATECEVDKRLTPVMLEASPHYNYSKNVRFCSLFVNEIIEGNAKTEAQKSEAREGVISPANGGGEGGYSTTLAPASPLSFCSLMRGSSQSPISAEASGNYSFIQSPSSRKACIG